MAGEAQEAPWPLPKFHFKVTLGDLGEIAFQEVSGLDTEVEAIEYRADNSKIFSKVKMPGLKKSSDVSLKKGICSADTKLFDWINSIQMNTIKRVTVTVQLLDESHEVLFSWTLNNAFPMKVTGTDFNAQNSEVSLEELVLAHEGVTMKAG